MQTDKEPLKLHTRTKGQQMITNIMLTIMVCALALVWIFNFVMSLVDFVGRGFAICSAFLAVACSAWAIWTLTLIWG